jgi:hypothetical protein
MAVLLLGVVVLPYFCGVPWSWFLEHGPVEKLQVAHLSFAIAATSIVSARHFLRRSYSAARLFFLLDLVLLWCVLRELDLLEGITEAEDVYVFGKTLIAVLFITVFIWNSGRLLPLVSWQWQADYFRLFVLALGGYALAQLVGWELSVIFELDSLAGRALEEGVELLFGCIFVFAACELMIVEVREGSFVSFKRNQEAPLPPSTVSDMSDAVN